MLEGARRNRGAIVLAAAVVAASASVGFVAARVGRSAREAGRVERRGAAAHAARDAEELHALRRAFAGRGRVVVSVSEHLHFEEVSADEAWAGNDAFPLRVFDLSPLLEAQVGLRNHLRVALRAGIYREIVHVVPSESLPALKAVARQRRIDVISIGDRAITLHEWGSRRTITDRLPEMGEPVVLELDASWFERGKPAALAAQLEGSDLAVDLVLLDFAADDPEVTAAGREALAAFGERFTRRGTDAP